MKIIPNSTKPDQNNPIQLSLIKINPNSTKPDENHPDETNPSRGESNSPRFTISVYGSSCSSLFFGLILSLFSFSIYFLASHPALGIQINRQRKPSSENMAEKEIITWTALQRNGKIRDYSTRLWCAVSSLVDVIKYYNMLVASQIEVCKNPCKTKFSPLTTHES